MNKSVFTIEPGKQELSVTRWLDAPRALVFKAHTDPAAIPQWWGPAVLVTTVELLEPKVGGRWRYVQLDPQGNVHTFHGVFHQVSEERIVQTFEYEGAAGHVLLETLILEEIGGKTKLTAHSVFQTQEARDDMVGSGMQRGFEEGMGRLEKLLAEIPAKA